MNEIPNCFYRVSVKALILNESRNKFLICEEDGGVWELPGGGFDWGMTPQEDLVREIQEEMGLLTTKVAAQPAYFMTDQTINRKQWIVNVLYETEVEHLNFTPSEECRNIRFVDHADIQALHVFPTVKKLASMFDPANHGKPMRSTTVT
jgi:ADP-ribose pyrophosphatase YjhB (NUDIX family)